MCVLSQQQYRHTARSFPGLLSEELAAAVEEEREDDEGFELEQDVGQ